MENKNDLMVQFNQLSEKSKNEFLTQLLLKKVEEVEEKAQEIEKLNDDKLKLQAKCETWELVSNSDDLFEMNEVAKVLNYKGFGRNKIFEFLRDIEVIRDGHYKNQPYQKYVTAGYFKQIEQVVNTENDVFINLKTVVTQKGIDFIRRKLYEHFGSK